MSARDTIHHALVRRYGTSGPADVNAILTALSAAGFAVVPVEPTVEMLTAGTEEWLTVRAMEDRAGVIYRAMLAAAQEDSSDA